LSVQRPRRDLRPLKRAEDAAILGSLIDSGRFWGRPGFDVFSEVGAACRGVRSLGKPRAKLSSADNNMALAA